MWLSLSLNFLKICILLWYTKLSIKEKNKINKSVNSDKVTQFLNPKENNDGFSKPMLLKFILSFGPLF